jgi:uncharacterized protein (DUF433 family)
MSKLYEIEPLFLSLTKSEKLQLLQWVVADLSDTFIGIETNPNICGGEPCIVRTRIPVWLLVQARRLGLTDSEILRAYPTLYAEDLTNAWNYFRAHHAQIEQQIQENETA